MSVSEAMQRFWARVEGERPTTRARIVATLLEEPGVVERVRAAGLDPDELLADLRALGEASAVGRRLRETVVTLLPQVPAVADRIGEGENVTEAGWELYGLYANPALTVAAREQRALHAADLVAHPTVVELSPARYASRVMRCLAQEMPGHAAALERCAAILES